MPFEIIVLGANKVVATQAAADTLIGKVQAAFGAETQILVNKLEKTFDSTSHEVGVQVTRVAEYPVVVVP